MKLNKKALEFSFSWIFALMVGAVIIFLAVYFASQFVKTSQLRQDTELGKELGIILTPIETNLETGKITKISMPQEARIFNECISNEGTFGKQKISISTKNLKDEWPKPGFPSSFNNKYIFSSEVVEGKNFFVFSKPLQIPFKVADLIYIWPVSEEYCFINPPNEIEEEITDLRLNITIAFSASECSRDSKKVCFASSGCDIDISLDSGQLKGSLKKKFSERVYFDGSTLLYASIFSDSPVYECQLKRLMKRTSELSWLYYSKSAFLSPKGCSSNLEIELSSYANKTFSLNHSLSLRDISLDSQNIRRKNDGLSCKLF
ncbi:MAG: hypothetical protein Q7S27_06390 [Nanoarchaeota archaeon]|nr:hypothetical protein [Nanoarchaeota archaeon]